MKNYTTIKTSHFMSICRMTLFFILAFTGGLHADGTKQAMPDPNNGVGMYITDGNGPYGPYLGSPANQRLHFHISDFTTEKLYFGVNPRRRNASTQLINNLYYRINDPNGNLVAGPFAFTTNSGDAGFIENYAQATAGPNIGGATPAGYVPFVLPFHNCHPS